MIVYGDRWLTVSPAERLSAIGAALRSGRTGRARHDQLMQALIETGELAQGLADAEFERRGCDDLSTLHACALDLAVAIARKVRASWDSGFAQDGPPADHALQALAARAPPGSVRCKAAEGYAHYAVYPEAYMAAARDLGGRRVAVIGLRSIGTSLGAAVAAASDAALFVTLRPHGHPFERRVTVSDDLQARLAAHDGPFAIVDEGPGLSGSSFGAAAELLLALGVARDQVIFMPSHQGAPGPQSTPRRRDAWERTRRLTRTLDDLAPPQSLAAWFEPVIGAALQVREMSHGLWRQALDPGAWPPVWASSERRKLQVTTGSGTYVARFAGLGAAGSAKFDAARALYAEGFSAEPISLRHGFLLERWLPEVSRAPPTRAEALGRLGDYLRFRSTGGLAVPARGADVGELAKMAAHNAEALCGPHLRGQVERRLDNATLLAGRLRPVWTDGRLHRWEWRLSPSGGLMKTDALDHACAHDLVGPQDIAWDLAGAATEFSLTKPELADLQAQVAGTQDPAALDVFQGLYCAFQGGLWALAAQGAQGDDRSRADRQQKKYAAALARWAQA